MRYCNYKPDWCGVRGDAGGSGTSRALEHTSVSERLVHLRRIETYFAIGEPLRLLCNGQNFTNQGRLAPLSSLSVFAPDPTSQPLSAESLLRHQYTSTSYLRIVSLVGPSSLELSIYILSACRCPSRSVPFCVLLQCYLSFTLPVSFAHFATNKLHNFSSFTSCFVIIIFPRRVVTPNVPSPLPDCAFPLLWNSSFGPLSQVPPACASCLALRHGAGALSLLPGAGLEVHSGLFETEIDDSQGVNQERTRRGITTQLHGTWESGQFLTPDKWPAHAAKKAPHHLKRRSFKEPFPPPRRIWDTDQYRGDVVPIKHEVRGDPC